jgi:hypothetical protein
MALLCKGGAIAASAERGRHGALCGADEKDVSKVDMKTPLGARRARAVKAWMQSTCQSNVFL